MRLVMVVVLSLLWSSLVWAANEVVGWEKLLSQYEVDVFRPSSLPLKNVKIAILDNGFEGYTPDHGLLPRTAELVNLTQIPPEPTNHGLGMAQITWALTGMSPEGPQFYLINTNGFSNLKAAVQFVIERHIDIVLYSQVWSFGGNLDGTGFINALVTRASQAGVIWINAAGNYGKMAYNGSVEKQRTPDSPFLNFGGRDFLRFENKFDENEVTLTLSWSDFKDDDKYCTPKDLDLLVYNEAGRLVRAAELTQKGQGPTPQNPGLSCYAREVINLQNLDRGNYQIKVRVRSNNFVTTDQFRIIIKSERTGSVVFTDHSQGGEIMPPADNPFAIIVGEGVETSSVGPTADGRAKPDTFIQDATIAFTNGMAFQGSSNAAAMLAGIIAVLKASNPRVTSKAILDYLRRMGTGPGPGPFPGGNYYDLKPPGNVVLFPEIAQIQPPGSEVMLSRINNHVVILTNEDPFDLPAPRSAGVRRNRPDDLLAYSLSKKLWFAVPKATGVFSSSVVEFRPKMPGYSTPHFNPTVWKTPTPAELDGWGR